MAGGSALCEPNLDPTHPELGPTPLGVYEGEGVRRSAGVQTHVRLVSDHRPGLGLALGLGRVSLNAQYILCFLRHLSPITEQRLILEVLLSRRLYLQARPAWNS